jgi:phosphatidylinositol N-acetylglucosaminyltransferase subunit Q
VVGSLLFTPILLLIPTTSVFYVFFSILTTTVIWVCVMLEIVIALIQSTPYAELTLWVMRRHRFPAGLFFFHLPSNGHTFEDDDLSSHSVGCCNETRKEDLIDKLSESLVSELHCSYATFGKMFLLIFA